MLHPAHKVPPSPKVSMNASTSRTPMPQPMPQMPSNNTQ